MLRGIAPAAHGLIDNANTPLVTPTPSFLAVARSAGLRTAAVTSWAQIDSLIEPDACVERIAIDSGYDPIDDDRVADHVAVLFGHNPPDVAFAYLIAPDLAGHDHGWGSDAYLESLTQVDAVLGRIVASVGPDVSIVATTDHGGVGTNHGETTPDVLDVFVAARAASIEPGSWWSQASTLDIAPTVMALADLAPSGDWKGRSLLGSEQPAVDVLIGLLEQTAQFSYGEDVSMLDHALQAAASAASDGLDDDLVLAALLHDLGHAVGDAGAYGDPDHAAVGARLLGPWLPATVVDPIRLHVDAKRRMVAGDESYLATLSEASVITLGQQGGPFDDAECARFDRELHAARAIKLRLADDAGKLSDPASAGLDVPPLESYRDLIRDALASPPLDPSAVRDSCVCSACRDAASGQHLIDVGDLAGWSVLGQRRTDTGQRVDLVRRNKQDEREHHRCELSDPLDRPSRDVRLWRSDEDLRGRTRPANAVTEISRDVMQTGVALVDGLSTTPGTVLTFANTLGIVRETNYGDLFDVRAEPEPINLAYSSVALPLHTDNPYRDPAPTVQILHCLMPAADGGATRLADGWAAADQLRSEAPDAFDALSTTVVRFRFNGEPGVDLMAERPILDVGPDGVLRSIALNHRSLVTPLSGQLAASFAQLVRRLDANAIELTLQPGEAIVFDNRRVLHARRGFDPTAGRHLQGCYIDIDALASRSSSAD